MTSEISLLLDELSARFGSTGAELWAELVRYEIASATAWAVGFAFFTFCLAIVAVTAWVFSDDDDFVFVAAIASAVSGLVTVIAAGTLWVTLQAPQAAVIHGLFQ